MAKTRKNMSISDIFKMEVQERFPDYTITPLKNTSHINVVRLSKEGSPSIIAKTIWHDWGDPTGDMGIKEMNKRYKNEVKILKLLPKWWGLQYVDHFQTKDNRIIVTNEIKNVSWTTYKKGHGDELIANELFKQIRWLHAHKIAHTDLELKNILLTDSGHSVVIDFEKSDITAKKTQMEDDFQKVLSNLKEFPNTKFIGINLEKLLNKPANKTRKARKS